MAIIGFNFTKVSAEKNEKSKGGNVNINNNISMKSVHIAEDSIASKDQKIVKYDFQFKSTYNPDLGSITLEGEVISIEDKKKAEEAEKSWKKDKTLPLEILQPVISTALNKSNVQALIMSQTVNLPPPIPLPKVETTDNKKAK